MGRAVRRKGDMFQVRLDDGERELLVEVSRQLRELLVSGEEDGLQRLFPPGYNEDEGRAEEYRLLTHDELLEKKLAALDVLEQTALEKSITEEQLTAWMTAINDVRLVIGTKLDVTEDDSRVFDLADPNALLYAVYRHLSNLLADIVDALADWS